MVFIQLVLLEGVLLLSAGMIFFGGIRGTVVATVVLSGLNVLIQDEVQFWNWEIPLLMGGIVGIALLFILGKRANKSNVVGGLIGGLSALVFFGAFVTPILAIIVWALVIGTGLMPKTEKSQLLWSLSPTFLRFLMGLGWIIYGNMLTI